MFVPGCDWGRLQHVSATKFCRVSAVCYSSSDSDYVRSGASMRRQYSESVVSTSMRTIPLVTAYGAPVRLAFVGGTSVRSASVDGHDDDDDGYEDGVAGVGSLPSSAAAVVPALVNLSASVALRSSPLASGACTPAF